jgi:hypothetical protein
MTAELLGWIGALSAFAKTFIVATHDRWSRRRTSSARTDPRHSESKTDCPARLTGLHGKGSGDARFVSVSAREDA